ncbi:MAG: hypothetical protein V9G08_03655 [Dermatophilaceae bacterium]
MRSVVSTLAPAVAVVAVVAVVAGFLVLLDRHLGGRVRALLCAVGVLGALATTWLLWPSGRLATRILDPVEGNPRALLVLGALALLATVGLGALAAAVRRHPTPAAELVLLAVAMVVAATWLPKSGWPAWRADGLLRLCVEISASVPARLQGVAEAVAEQVDRQHRDHNRQPRKGGDPPGVAQIAASFAQDQPPFRRRRLGAQPQEAERGAWQ